ncbi:sodium:solute symporter family protein [Thiotrichales bacterium HSG1]|nr:sodium:solute symporter family protein [Thiotrichales bacterium HSG1]
MLSNNTDSGFIVFSGFFILTLIVLIVLYWGYCILWGFRGWRSNRTPTDYFLAGRSLSFWNFVFAATATCFSGWTFISHPGAIFTGGFPAAYASFYAIAIPFTGMLFLKRQWLLGKIYNFITPAEMFDEYFQSKTMRYLVVVVASLFAVTYLAVQLRASGYLFGIVIGGIFGTEEWETWISNISMIILAFVLAGYVAVGGLRAVAKVDAMQLFLLIMGIVTIGILVWFQVGIGKINQGIFQWTEFDYARVGAEEYSHYLAIPETPLSGNWTTMFILTFMLALMGIQTSPAFSMWAFAAKTPKSFAFQQVFASSLIMGGVMFIFITIQGAGSHLLGADGDLVHSDIKNLKTVIEPVKKGDELVPSLISMIPKSTYSELKNITESNDISNLMSSRELWKSLAAIIIACFLTICALAAMQSTASSYIITTSAIWTRDVFERRTEDNEPIKLAVVISFVVVMVAIFIAFMIESVIVQLGGLAVAFGLQMLPALVAICYRPRLTKQGIMAGIIVGLIAVILTDKVVTTNLITFLPWSKTYPLTIHSAFWGFLFNWITVFIVSFTTLNQKDEDRRMEYHRKIRKYATLSESKKIWKPLVLVFTIIWFLFAIGPFATIGNWFFGNPNDINTWWFGIPSIWAWQILWWLIGVFMMWVLAYKMEMSTMSDDKIAKIEEICKSS